MPRIRDLPRSPGRLYRNESPVRRVSSNREAKDLKKGLRDLDRYIYALSEITEKEREKRERLWQKRRILINVLAALQEKEYAVKLAQYSEGRQKNRHEDTYAYDKGIREESGAGMEPHIDTLEDVEGRKTERVARKALEVALAQLEDAFVRQERRTRSDALRQFSKDAYTVMTRKSTRNGIRAIYIWDQAFQAQADLCRIYKSIVTDISRSRDEIAASLREDMYPRRGRPTDLAADEVRKMRLRIQRYEKEDKEINGTKYKLSKALEDMARLHRKAGSTGSRRRRNRWEDRRAPAV